MVAAVVGGLVIMGQDCTGHGAARGIGRNTWLLRSGRLPWGLNCVLHSIRGAAERANPRRASPCGGW